MNSISCDHQNEIKEKLSSFNPSDIITIIKRDERFFIYEGAISSPDERVYFGRVVEYK